MDNGLQRQSLSLFGYTSRRIYLSISHSGFKNVLVWNDDVLDEMFDFHEQWPERAELATFMITEEPI